MSEARSYRFADSNRPGLLLGLSARQAIPVIVGAVPRPRAPDAVAPAGRSHRPGRRFGRGVRAVAWHPARRDARPWRPALRAAGDPSPAVGPTITARRQHQRMRCPSASRPRAPRTVRPSARGRPGQGRRHGDRGAAGPRPRVPARRRGRAGRDARRLGCCALTVRPRAVAGAPGRVAGVGHPVGSDAHRAFLDAVGIDPRRHDPAVADYLALVDEQAPVTIAHEVLVAVTVDQRRVRARRSMKSPLGAAVDALSDESRRLRHGSTPPASRRPSVSALELSAAVRVRSDPTAPLRSRR